MVQQAVEKAYESLPIRDRTASRAWRDVSSMFEDSLPAGLAYDVAEEILWYAGFGFRWARRIAAKPFDESLKICPTQALSYRLIPWPIGYVEVSVMLVPDRRTRFDTVERTCVSIRGERWT
jgi:hypothetical protein